MSGEKHSLAERTEEWRPAEAEGCNHGIDRGKLDAPGSSAMVNVADQTGKRRQAERDGVWMAEQPQVPQPLPISLVLQTLPQLRCPSLDTLQHLNVSLGVGGPTLNTAFESLPALQQINTPTQLGVICKLTEGALDPFVQIIDKDIKQNWPQHRALGNTTCDRPPTGVNSIHHHSLGPAIQPVLYPAKSTPVQAMSSQFLQENVLFFINRHLVSISKQRSFLTQNWISKPTYLD
ncbi:hypothetical protein QYF61_013007 [Mycteria americana]|uniref:Uncharacterized protein n=1 Tax=Mycteria americana TaxID=33587 RepID=A0AAN7P876_MYCAM|nr:hypothetical protein QYF61_013007 [Mycteria americana]